MVVTIPEIKNRFASLDKPSAKDFSDLIDTLVQVIQDNTITAAKAQIIVPTAGANVILQPTPPNSSNAGSVWLKTDSSTGAIVRAYNYFPSGSGGDNNWHARHPVPPGATVVVFDSSWINLPLSVFDGGGTPGSGAMWEWVTLLNGKFVIGVDPANFPIATNGGEAAHTLIQAELPAISITPTIPKNQMSGFDSGNNLLALGPDNGSNYRSTDMALAPLVLGSGNAHNNIPPYQTGYYIRRTTRLDYVEAPGV